MKERGIIFSAPMVRALLEGQKTQTRRIVKPQPPAGCEYTVNGNASHALCFAAGTSTSASPVCVPPTARSKDHRLPCPYGEPGDRLWVRETHAQFVVGNRAGDAPQCVAYRATCDADGGFDYVNNGDEVMRLKVTKWTPAIHMPRWASRLTLAITQVRAEQLQDISHVDIRAEGVSCPEHDFPGGFCISECPALRAEWVRLWSSINGERAPWSSNPWVWAVTFEVERRRAP